MLHSAWTLPGKNHLVMRSSQSPDGLPPEVARAAGLRGCWPLTGMQSSGPQSV